MYELKPLPFAYDALDGITEQVTRWHYDVIYAGFVEKRNEVERKLESVDRSESNPRHSEFSGLKRDEVSVTNGMNLHSLYYKVLGGDGNPEGTMILQRIIDDFGSLEIWQEDFVACARSSMGWALLAWDSIGDKLRNYVDSSESHGVWGAFPLIVLDMAEHAYYYDHGPKRSAYIDAFLANLNWQTIDTCYQRTVRE